LLADLTFISKSNFCIDCTAEYQKQMVLEKKCHYPTTYFKFWKGDVVGMCEPEVLRRKVSDFPAEVYGKGSRREPPLAYPLRESSHPTEDEDGFD